MALQRDYAQFEARGYKARVRLGTTAPLPTYTVSGDFQTLTAVGNVQLPNIDGVPPAPGNDILYFSGVGVLARNNGIYTITQVGSTGVSPFILQRRAGFSDSSQIAAVSQVSIAEGGLAGTIFNLREITEPISLGVDDLVFEPVSGGGAGVFELIANGESTTIPENQKLLHNDDLTIGEIETLIAWNGTGGADLGGDWARTGVGGEAPGAAFSGTNGLDTGAQSAGTTSKFNNGSLLDVAGLYTTVSLQLQPKLYPVNANLTIQWQDAGQSLVGSVLNVEDYVDMTLDVWQRVVIPIEAFALGGDVQFLALTYDDVGVQQHWVDDIELQAVGGAELDLEGSLEQVETSRNFSENVIPIRTRRVIEQGEQMLHSGVLRVDGVLQIDGLLTDVTPSTAQQLLATLGEVVALDEFLIGGGSPVKAVGAAEARAAMDTLSTSEITAAIAAGSGSPFGMTLDASPQLAGFTPTINTIHLLSTCNGFTITFPTGVADGAMFGLWGENPNSGPGSPGGEPNAVWTLTTAGSTLINTVTIAGCNSIPYHVLGSLTFYKYNAVRDVWDASSDMALELGTVGSALVINTCGGFPTRIVLGCDGIITRPGAGTPQSLSLAPNEIFARCGSQNLAPMTVPQHSVLANAAGAFSPLGFGTDTLLLRCGSANLFARNIPVNSMVGNDGTLRPLAVGTDALLLRCGSSALASKNIPSAQFVGRPTGGGLGPVTKAQALTILNVEDGADVTDSTNVNAAGAVMESDFTTTDSILKADSIGTPVNLQMGQATMLANKTGTISAFNSEQIYNLLQGIGTSTETLDSKVGNQQSWFGSSSVGAWRIRWTGVSDMTVQGIDINTPNTTNQVFVKYWVNDSASSNIILKHEDGAAAAIDRLNLPNDADITIRPGQAFILWYDENSTPANGRWRVIGAPAQTADVAVALGVNQILNAQTTTSDATPTTITSFVTLVDDTTARFKFTLTALEIATDDSAHFDVSALFHRSNTGSTVTSKDISFVNGPFKDAGAAAWTVTMTIAAQTINIVVTGEAAHTIKWKITGTVVED